MDILVNTKSKRGNKKEDFIRHGLCGSNGFYGFAAMILNK
jgi:hypothetical protein